MQVCAPDVLSVAGGGGEEKGGNGGFCACWVADCARADVPLDCFVEGGEEAGAGGEVGAHVGEGFDCGAFDYVDDGVAD